MDLLFLITVKGGVIVVCVPNDSCNCSILAKVYFGVVVFKQILIKVGH